MKRPAAATTVHGLDVFRSARAQEVAARWERVSDEHRVAVARMWLGTIATSFDGFELAILRDMGFLSQADESLLKRANATTQTGNTT